MRSGGQSPVRAVVHENWFESLPLAVCGANWCSGESSPTQPKVSYLEIARVHRQLWRSNASDSCWSSRVSANLEMIARNLTFEVSSNQITVKLLVVAASNVPEAEFHFGEMPAPYRA
jgi:hypothetical protein